MHLTPKREATNPAAANVLQQQARFDTFAARRRAPGLVTFMRSDLGYFDDETCRVEPIDNPFIPKVLPMSSE
jgi:hypothetical protein